MITVPWLIASAVAGVITAWLAGRLMTGNGLGLPGDVIVGILGAVIGGSVLRTAGLNLGNGLAAQLVVAFIAAAIVLFLVHELTGRRRGHRMWS
jgi:uncharacterized membrane protein YeaQ/YmgE (transglycosylase-associated protein family)